MQPNDPGNSQSWTYRKEDETDQAPAQAAPAQPHNDIQPVNWTASEFIAHHKGASWYMALGAGIGLLCFGIYILYQDIVSIIAIVIGVVLYLMVTSGHPRQRTYGLNNEGIQIDDKFYPYSEFKSFMVSQEGAIGCITFMPLKRLLPELSIYFAPEDGDKIFSVLANTLPNDQKKERPVDRLIKKLHF